MHTYLWVASFAIITTACMFCTWILQSRIEEIEIRNFSAQDNGPVFGSGFRAGLFAFMVAVFLAVVYLAASTVHTTSLAP